MQADATVLPPTALRAPVKSAGLAAVLMAVGLCVVVAGVGAAGFSPDGWPVFAVGLLYLAALAWRQSKRPRAGVLPAWASPPVLITAWALAWVYLPALAAFFDDSLLDDTVVANGGEALLVTGVLLACVSMTVLSFSFHATSSVLRRAPAAAEGFRLGTLPLALGLYAVSAAARAYRLRVLGIAFGADLASWGPLQSVDQWIGYVEDLRFLALVLLVAHVVRFGRGHLWLGAALGIELVFAATSGFLMPLIRPIVACLVTAAVLGRPRVRHVALLGAGALLVMTFLPVANAIRQDQTGAMGTAPRGGLSRVADAGTYWLDGLSHLDVAYTKYFGRQAEVASSTGLVVALVPGIVPYEGIEKFLTLPANLIPRVFWPDKPTLSRGVWFSVAFRGLEDDTTSWSAMTIFSEGYMFFGWTGVVLAMLVAGAVLAAVGRGVDRPRLAIVYLALVPTILEIEPELSSYLTTLVQRSIVFVVVFLVLTHRSQR